MKLLYSILFVVISALSVFGQKLPEQPNPPRIVNDFANLLSPQEVQQLESKLRAYNDTTSTQIAIVVVPSLDGYDPSEYAFALGKKWGIGQKGKNNGILVLIKPKVGNERGQVFIATGYGMEGSITDARANRIIDQTIIPAFRQNKYYEGLDQATTQLIQFARGEFKADKKGAKTVSPFASILIFIVLVAVFGIIAAIARSKKYTSGSVYSSGGFQRHSSAASNLPFWLLLMGMGSNLGDRHRNSGSGWSDFSGGGGGGFGGFGGGDFGGGGAGGSW
ncbi:TPM domain-containing protein [Alistipes sp. ZOR0009]|uniref:TPM domain-containing protein n=1 Tax=Alistipes sp. ZOR0009 TaxID=1339253 RepID=UPI000646A969|nr:TPM domain-containing protein [Alistipes sp. ZOR0009]